MKRLAIFSFLVLSGVLWLAPTSALAVQPSERLLPPTTKGYLAVADMDLLRESFEKTQLGQLAQDPLMKPFFQDIREQFESKVGRTDIRLSITLDDLKDVYGGEVCLAMVQPEEDEKQHATVLLVDITGHQPQADALLARIARELQQKGAKRGVERVGDTQLITYVLPRKEGETESQRAFYFIKDDQLVASDHQATVKQILAYFANETGSRFADLKSYQATMKRCAESSGGVAPHLRWFVEPFGYVQTVRAAAGGRQRRGTDILKALAGEGFDAIQGAGGFVSFSSEGADIVHRTFVYAPPVNRVDKYRLAARMLQFPNVEAIQPEDWVPLDASNYLSFRWKMKEAFEFSKSLVDELAGAPVFEDILDSLKHDPSGPQVDIREGLIKHLGQRVTFFTDYRLPITATSERWLMAFEITDPAAVAKTLDKAMEADPDATRRRIGRQNVWEILRQEEEMEVEELDIGGVGFGAMEEVEEEEEGAPLLEHAALTVSYGYLIVASHVDFLEQVFAEAAAKKTLGQAEDFARVDRLLTNLGAGEISFRFFSRTDKATHTTYELIRQGKMPESETLLGGALNRLLGPEERGVLREQQIKGDKLPEYEKVRQYFGPAGFFIQSEDEGWFMCGGFLPQHAETEAAPAEAKPAAKPAAEAKPAADAKPDPADAKPATEAKPDPTEAKPAPIEAKPAPAGDPAEVKPAPAETEPAEAPPATEASP